ncbi:hypothetical protein PMNALOAF_1969 [Methylobacterium adhaesivum]|jgi:hypothetical protein|uniref:DUF1489 domain-containing protein n=1 Tax=Methylobacterium adhaesivum TaxID=333297 RepID=A0ABT8BGM1_9HYPH|nr:DUF1489 domain-containing protein [Methylobacterium adhaesivum]MDN3590349.1 DUF1489 domain-containing protein [Methylobacterium adhaesivum]GJD30719.1 hypothetical protein PMNALOAF_1969 [Methylobacterium adhaesivum]
MSLHLLKLCVGPASIAELEARIAQTRVEALAQGRDPAPAHVTRMVPTRAAEIVGGGSIYWVIKGTLACRQAIASITPVTGSDGIGRCRLVLDPVVVPVSPRPCRPFQGWRYLKGEDAPADLDGTTAGDLADMPEALRRELAGLGLI